jgi:transcriptional regulator with XRE-family HTH domain
MSIKESKKIGELLRGWRERRRLSQLDLAYDTEISQKHLSFIELGRSSPSREMILRLSEQLEIPLRERNVLLAAGGFASVFPERSLDDESLSPARKAVDLILEGLEPNPSFAVDRHWTLVAANNAASIFNDEVDPELLKASANMLRICLHPRGFTPRVINYEQWRKNVLEYLHKQVQATADNFLIELYDELKSYPKPKRLIDTSTEKEIDYSGFAIPLRLMGNDGELSFISTLTVFGTPIDVTVSELAIETFFPADEKTAEALRKRHNEQK